MAAGAALGPGAELGPGPAAGAKLINARAETLTRRPTFRSLVERRRALVPASGFYEWRRPGPDNGNYKQPFYFQRADTGPLVFAGLWDLWQDAEGLPLRSCTIITTSANQMMAPVHHRMPLVLAPENWDEWLRPGPLRTARLAELAVPPPDELLTAYPVGNKVNKALNDGPDLIEPQLAEPQLIEAQLIGPQLEVVERDAGPRQQTLPL